MLRGLRYVGLCLGVDAIADNPQLRRRKIVADQRVADMLRDADYQSCLPLQCCGPPLEDGWDQRFAIMLCFGRVTAVKRHDERQFQGAGDRQCECTPATEMRMDDPRAKPSEIRSRRNVAELLKQESVERA